MVTFQTACKFPGIAGRVQLWVIHLTLARWQIASNLLSRASVTVGRAVARYVHIAGVALIVPTYWVTGSHRVTRMAYRKNILVNANFQLDQDTQLSREIGEN